MLQPELKPRRDKIRVLMAQQDIDAALIACNVNLIYTYGRVVSGYLYIPLHSPAHLFIKRPNNIRGEHVHPIHKPELIPSILEEVELGLPKKIMLEADDLSYTEYNRLAKVFEGAEIINGSPIIRSARTTKTKIEIEKFKRGAALHASAYEKIPSIYKGGMTDLEFSIEVERLMRLEGVLGIFRTNGREMEIFMGSILAGDNAIVPSSYDFALGGAGLDPSIPIGVSNTPLKEGQSIMVDMGGNFNGYHSDMTRVFSVGKLPDEAYAAHQACIDLQDKIAEMAKPGVICEDIYQLAIDFMADAGYSENFMGFDQQVKFIGHGIGLEINELPVFCPRNRQALEQDMVFALEPKIVLPGIGAVGIENSWVVTGDSIEKITLCKEEIIELS